jgi:hypothetical protein
VSVSNISLPVDLIFTLGAPAYAGTAPSSPLPLVRDGGSEHEDTEQGPAPLPAEDTAEIAPLPIYPLPSKPVPCAASPENRNRFCTHITPRQKWN